MWNDDYIQLIQERGARLAAAMGEEIIFDVDDNGEEHTFLARNGQIWEFTKFPRRSASARAVLIEWLAGNDDRWDAFDCALCYELWPEISDAPADPVEQRRCFLLTSPHDIAEAADAAIKAMKERENET